MTAVHRTPHPARSGAADVATGLLVALVGTAEVVSPSTSVDGRFLASMAVVLGTAVACGLFRRAPGVALLALLTTGFFQVTTGADLLLTQVSLLVVAYGASRHGSTLLVWLSGVALPFAPLFAFWYLGRGDLPSVGDTLRVALSPRSDQLVGPVLLGTGSLAFFLLPWFLGLVLRGRERTLLSREEERAALEARDRARAESAQATEIARLRSGQARLARDVHDVVGHSLAVILAQAESAQYLVDDDPVATRRAMASIAGSARQSLQDVRAVLGSGDAPQGTGALPRGSLQSLIDDVRTAGVPVEDRERGDPSDLSPAAQTVAFRVLQEMLTNALKHGRRDRPVVVRRVWSHAGLTLEVVNDVRAGSPPGAEGRGITGLRQRLAGVQGHLTVRSQPTPDGSTYVATASVPPTASRAS